MIMASIKSLFLHKEFVCPGDVIYHNGAYRTVSKNNIKHNEFMGRTIFGDSFKLGRQKVEVLDIRRTNPYGAYLGLF